jgi:hypothetical protein
MLLSAGANKMPAPYEHKNQMTKTLVSKLSVADQ